jgi:hypothetical protein
MVLFFYKSVLTTQQGNGCLQDDVTVMCVGRLHASLTGCFSTGQRRKETDDRAATVLGNRRKPFKLCSGRVQEVLIVAAQLLLSRKQSVRWLYSSAR